MMVTEIIGGIECVFPESKEASFSKFFNLTIEALYREIQRGKVTMEDLDEILREQEILLQKEEEEKKND